MYKGTALSPGHSQFFNVIRRKWPGDEAIITGFALHSLLLREHLHCLEQVWQSGNKGSQDEEIIEGERAVEVDLLANHLHGNGKRWPEVRVHRNIQEPYDDTTPYSHMVDLEMAK